MAATMEQPDSALQRLVSTVKPKLEPYISMGIQMLNQTRHEINNYCTDVEAWQLILYTLVCTLVGVWLYAFLFDHELSLRKRIKLSFFRYVRYVPFVGTLIQKEIDKTKKNVAESLFNVNAPYITSLPDKGLSEPEVLKLINDNYETIEGSSWSSGKVSGAVYNGSEELTRLTTKVYGQFAWANPLHPDVFPGVRKMEAEVVSMCCKMFNGGPESCGTMTAGGTESILMACRAYREMAYDRGIKRPEILAPISVHSAFDKAADYFKMKIVHVPQDDITMKCDVKAMARMINKNTCMLVGSAPQFPHGTVDPIDEMSKLAIKYKLPLHVDSCLGGFLVPFMEKAGFYVPPFDFRLEGVTSISADTHKYGYAPKGSSVIMYRNRNYRCRQYYINPDWQGGVYASPTIAGSRAGALIAATWAVMVHFGEQGYIEATRKIIETTRYIESGVAMIPGIYIVGKPEVSVIAIGSLDFNIFTLADDLTKRGWNLNSLQFPACVHLCVTILHTKEGIADMFLDDVKLCAENLLKSPKTKAEGQAAIYGLAQTLPDRSVISEVVTAFLDACYKTENSKPHQNGIE